MADNPTTHTPGPWATDRHFAERSGGRTYLPVVRLGNDPVPIAVVHRDVDGFGRKEGEANANLISAAPEMFKALADLVQTFHARPDILRLCGFHENAQIKAACDALNKANGRSVTNAQ